MPSRLKKILTFRSIPGDLVALALLNGLSNMALSGAGIFGMLAVLGGKYFLHGLGGLGFYVLGGAVATFIGYAGVCLYGARLGLKYRAALITVFVVHAIGFIIAALVHPAFVALSAGLGLGMFYSVFMLRNINEIPDKSRDKYATLSGIIQQAVSLIAPVFGAIALYWATKAGMHHPFVPTFLVFAVCVLLAIPLILQMPNRVLPHSVSLPFHAVFARGHISSAALFVSTIICDSMMNPLLIVSSFALLAQAVDVGWFTALISVLAGISLLFSQRVRLTGKRWIIMSICLVSIGASFAFANAVFEVPALLFAGAVFAIARANYGAAWFGISTRVMEHEWGAFGKNRALVLGEMFVLIARTLNAALLLACGYAGLTLRGSVDVMSGCFLIAAIISSFLARFLDKRHKQQMEVIV